MSSIHVSKSKGKPVLNTKPSVNAALKSLRKKQADFQLPGILPAGRRWML
jgi:hypothetical protein